MRNLRIFIFFLFVLIFIPHTYAQEPIAKIQGFLINADSMFRDTENEQVELEGRVQLVYQEQHISCQKARISLRSKKVEAIGQVLVASPKMTIGGEHIILDYESGTGIIYNGFVQSGSVIFEGSVLEKLNDTDFFVSKADFTTCRNCPSTWSFSGTSIKAELGGYAYIKNSIMRVGSVPIFWLPYLIVPLKSDRQSGLLTPGFENSDKGGFTYSQSYFWAINRNTDSTFTFKNYELRGAKGLFEYRYVLNEDSFGKLNFGGIDDQVFRDETRLNLFRPSSVKGQSTPRWFIKYDNYTTVPYNYTLRTQIRNVSDLQYPIDFEDELKTTTNLEREVKTIGDPALENRVSLTKNTKDQHFSVDTSYYTNLLRGDPMATNDNAVHRIPELRFSQTAKSLADTSILYSFDLVFTNFTRAGPAYDDLDSKNFNEDPKNKIRYIKTACNSEVSEDSSSSLCKPRYDGNFDPTTDLIRTGQRLDVQPTIYRPFTLASAFEITPSLTYRETHYNFNVGNDPTNIRRYLRTELNSRTTFSNIFGDQHEIRGTLWKHEIQPEITYTYLPWINHKRHQFFGFLKPGESTNGQQEVAVYNRKGSVNDNDTGSDSGLQFDYNDRIYDRNLVTYSITNKFIQKRWMPTGPQYRQVALLRLSQSYDAFEATRDDPNKQPWTDITGFFEVRLDNFQTNSLVNYYPYQKVSDISSRTSVNDDKGRFVELGLSRQYKIIPGQDASPSDRIQDISVGMGLMSSYLNLLGRFTYDAKEDRHSYLDERIKSYSYITQLKPPGECWVLSFSFKQITGGERKWKMDLLFNFDGQPIAPPASSLLDDI